MAFSLIYSETTGGGLGTSGCGVGPVWFNPAKAGVFSSNYSLTNIYMRRTVNAGLSWNIDTAIQFGSAMRQLSVDGNQGLNGLVATGLTVYKTTNAGLNWTQCGATVVQTAVSAVMIDSSYMCVGTAGGNLNWSYSNNGGASWSTKTQGASKWGQIQKMIWTGGTGASATIVSLANCDHRLGAGSQPTIFTSTDSGATWAQTSIMASYPQQANGGRCDLIDYGGGIWIAMLRNESIPAMEIWKSTDSCANWTFKKQFTYAEGGGLCKLHNGEIYCFNGYSGGISIHKSADAGETWSSAIYTFTASTTSYNAIRQLPDKTILALVPYSGGFAVYADQQYAVTSSPFPAGRINYL